MKGSKRYFILGIVFVFLQVIFDMINPKVMGYTVDYIVGDTQSIPGIVLTFVEKMGGRDDVLSHLWLIAIVIILFGIFGAVSRYLFRLFNSIGGENLARRMRNTLFEHILKLPYISVEIKDVRGNELVDMLKDNYESDNFDCDVVICSDCDGTLFKELIEPGIVYTWIPDDIANVMKDGSDMRELEFMGESMMLCYNTNVYDVQPVENLWELTEDRFQGKIMMANPLKSFSTYAFMAMLLQKDEELKNAYENLYGTSPSPNEGETVARMFERMLVDNAVIAHASDEVVESVGNSDDEIQIGIVLSSKMRFMKLGYHFAPIYKLNPISSVYTPNCISVAGGAKNINAAKLFIRYLTGDADGKSIGHEPFNTAGTWSVRRDIPDGDEYTVVHIKLIQSQI